MSITEIIYEAKCKDCHFHTRDSYTHKKRVLTKCMWGYEKVQGEHNPSWLYWNRDQIQSAPVTTLRSKACKNFVLFGLSEAKVQEILKERRVDND